MRNLGVALLIAATTRSATVSALASFRRMKRAGLAATIKARWICEQAHQQLKEKLGLDHFEGRSWQGLDANKGSQSNAD